MKNRVLTLLLTISMLAAAGSSQAQTVSRALRKKLATRISATWRNQTAGVVIRRLATAGGIGTWVDRRVNPDLEVTAQLDQVALLDAFAKLIDSEQIAAQQLAAIPVGEVVYVGPQRTAEALPKLLRQARRSLAGVPSKQKRLWLQSEPATWPELSEPRALIAEWLQQAQAEGQGVEKVPHDLWPKISLPPMPTLDRLVVLLANFDLTCRVTSAGKRCEIFPVDSALFADHQRNSQPSPRPRAAGNQRQQESADKTNAQDQRYSLRLANQPVGPVLDQLGRQLQLEIVWPGNAEMQKSLRERTSTCTVENGTIADLLRTVLSAANLSYQQEAQRIVIRSQAAQ